MTRPGESRRRGASSRGGLAAGLVASAAAAFLVFTCARRPETPAAPKLARAPALAIPRPGARQEYERRLRCADLIAALAALKKPALRERARAHGLDAVEDRHLQYWLPRVRRAAREAHVGRSELEYSLSRRAAVIERPEDLDRAAPAASACLAEARQAEARGRRRS